MAIAYVADRATANSNTGVTTVDLSLASMTVGNTLIIRASGDNSGGGGAARTCTVTNQSGSALNLTTDVQDSHNNDPGAANAGVTGFMFWGEITATSGTVRLTFSGSMVVAVQAEEWSGIDNAALPSAATFKNFTQGSTFFPSTGNIAMNAGDLLYIGTFHEGPASDTLTGDSDTDAGAWVSLTKVGTSNGTADANQTTWGQYKIPNATQNQAWLGTLGTARDTVGLGVKFVAATDPRHQRHVHPYRRQSIFRAVR